MDPRVEGIRSVLIHLRTRSGLSADRLRTTEVGVAPIFELPVIRHLVQAGGEPEDAAVEAVRQLARRLAVTDMLIVDAALALGLLRELVADTSMVEPLYVKDLGQRREQLVAQWRQVHELCGASEIPTPPSVRALRTALELRALERLAQLCVSTLTLELDQDVTGEVSEAGVPSRRSAGLQPVAVIGGAVMDHIVVADHFPELGTSVPAKSFVRHPGGKALNQAVAVARLGLPVDLIAAVGDDEYSDAILAYLRREGLRTDLVKRVPSARAPVTVVAIDHTGNHAVFGWMNDMHVKLDPADIEGGDMRAAIESASAVILTFETPIDAMRSVFEVVRHHSAPLIVHPSPPKTAPQLLYQHLSRVDYLVGTSWELGHLLPQVNDDAGPDRLIAQLLLLGVGAVCIVEHFGCLLRSADSDLEVGRLPTALKDTPGARDAFSAALTYRIVKTGGKLTEADLRWSVAAMAATPSFERIPSSMPSADEIGQVLAISPGFEKS